VLFSFLSAVVFVDLELDPSVAVVDELVNAKVGVEGVVDTPSVVVSVKFEVNVASVEEGA